jgi:hypothetical protein
MSRSAWVVTATIEIAVVVYGYLGTQLPAVMRLLKTSPVEAPREPTNLLEQLVRRSGGSLRAFLALVGVAVVGTTVNDFDRDVHNGLGNMVSFLVLVAGLIVLWWGFSVGWTVFRTAKGRGADADDAWLLATAVWAYAVGIVYGLLLVAGLLAHVLHRN